MKDRLLPRRISTEHPDQPECPVHCDTPLCWSLWDRADFKIVRQTASSSIDDTVCVLAFLGGAILHVDDHVLKFGLLDFPIRHPFKYGCNWLPCCVKRGLKRRYSHQCRACRIVEHGDAGTLYHLTIARRPLRVDLDLVEYCPLLLVGIGFGGIIASIKRSPSVKTALGPALESTGGTGIAAGSDFSGTGALASSIIPVSCA